MHGLRPAVHHNQRRFVSTLRLTKHNARPQQCQRHAVANKTIRKSGAKYWFRNNASVELCRSYRIGENLGKIFSYNWISAI